LKDQLLPGFSFPHLVAAGIIETVSPCGRKDADVIFRSSLYQAEAMRGVTRLQQTVRNATASLSFPKR
jgi:hypothetical protein